MMYRKIEKDNPLILASASPRRKMLLEQIGLPFYSSPSRIDEDQVDGRPTEIVIKLAKKKAMAVGPNPHNNWRLGADTLVVLDDFVLGKPSDYKEAGSMLNHLSGRTHEVITGFAIINPSGRLSHTEYVVTSVSIKQLSVKEISSYIATGEPFGKAGSYAIQGIGSFMVKEIRGSYSNVVGLPVSDLIESLLALGALEEFPLPPDAG